MNVIFPYAPLLIQGRKARLLLLFVLIAFVTLLPSLAQAQNRGPMLIRDTEIEGIIKEWAEPIIKAADLDPEAVNIVLVSDDGLNAFVAGGANIFLYSGLLSRSESASEVLGVIAHELGHIRGGHLVRTRGAMGNASMEALLGTLAGIGAAVLTGEGQLGAAISSGAQSMAISRFLSFSRVQESSADQAALSYFEKAEMSPNGLISFMRTLENQELLPAGQQVEYVRTHPLTRNRVDALENGAARNPHRDRPEPAEWAGMHARMKAKLAGFLKPEQVAWDYDRNDQAIEARYAHAIAAYRQNRVEEALRLTDGLIQTEPENSFFYELKGQMLVDFGRVAEALPYYKQALDLEPQAALIRASYAHAMIESAGRDESRLREAVNHLQRAAREEPRIPRTHRLLATAYGRLEQDAMARLHLAEEAFLRRDLPYAKRQAQAALQELDEGAPPAVRAQDILNAVEQEDKSD